MTRESSRCDECAAPWKHNYGVNGHLCSDCLVLKLSAAIEGESAAYQAGYEAALEDLRNGAIPMWIGGPPQ